MKFLFLKLFKQGTYNSWKNTGRAMKFFNFIAIYKLEFRQQMFAASSKD
jgi:hypothetical protein